MKILVPDIYQDFKCIGGDCIKTCCQGWTIVVDADTVQKYKESDDSFLNKVINNLSPIEESKDMSIILDSDEKCPMLDENGLCRIVLNNGEDYISHVCQTYPRISTKYLDTVFATVCPSCPEVARMIIDRKDFISFAFDEIPDNEHYENADWTLYNELINALVISTDIIQYIELPLSARFELLLSIAEIIDTHIANNTVAAIRADLEIFKNENYIRSFINKDSVKYSPVELVPKTLTDNTSVPKFIREYFSAHHLGNYINKIEYAVKKYEESNRMLEYTNLSTLFIFEYFMDVLNGLSLKKNICKMLTLMLLIQQLQLIDSIKSENISKEDFILEISMACSLLKHSSILNQLTDSLINNNSDDKLIALTKLIL